MQKNIKLQIFCFLLLAGTVLSAQVRKDLLVSIQPIQGAKNAFLLLCSAEEHSSARNASSVFTTRLPSLPLKLDKWEESIYVLSNRKMPMQKVRLLDDITFTYPIAGISRKAKLIRDPDFPGEYKLYLFWYEGKMNRFMEIKSFRIWSVVTLKPGKLERIGSVEMTK